jgi:glycerate kinase
MGKGVGEIAGMARRLDIPCLGIAGTVPDTVGVFSTTHAVSPDLASFEEAMREPGLWLVALAARVAEAWREG